MIKALIFDFDGTLVDSNKIKKEAFFEVTSSYHNGRALIKESLARNIGKDRFSIFNDFVSLQKNGDFSKDFQTLSRKLVEKYSSHCLNKISTCQEISGTTNLLLYMSSAPIKLFVNSATPQNALKEIVRARYMESYFDGIYGGPKNKAEIIRYICETEDVSSDEILMIGDGWQDKEAAEIIGCKFVHVSESESNENKLQIQSLEKLIDIVNDLNQ